MPASVDVMGVVCVYVCVGLVLLSASGCYQLLMFTFKLGTAGAAQATSIAQWIGAAAYGIRIFQKRADLGMSSTAATVAGQKNTHK